MRPKHLSEATLVGNTLVVPDSDGFIVYCPYNKNITHVTQSPLSNVELRAALTEGGFLGDLPRSVKKDASWEGFTNLTLFMTRRCNLRCVYCYATAGVQLDAVPDMTPERAEDAVRWFIAQLPKSRESIRVSFHGGGEPTLNLSVIKRTVEVVKASAKERPRHLLITTNGVMRASTLGWLMKEGFAISISADGPPDIQNRNRPMASGKGSSEKVEETIRRLVEADYPFTVRVTFSANDNVAEIVKYFGQAGVKSIHLEPLFPHGREYEKVCFDSGSHAIDAPVGLGMAHEFMAALDAARECGVRVTNSHLSNFNTGLGYFCGGARGRSMMLTHDGHLTACLEVVDGKEPEMLDFQLGRWEEDSQNPTLDHENIEKFRHRHVDSMPLCAGCFARFICAGGCAIKGYRATGDFLSPDISYCQFTKTVVPLIVQRIYHETFRREVVK
jgi:uncharacterized protein